MEYTNPSEINAAIAMVEGETSNDEEALDRAVTLIEDLAEDGAIGEWTKDAYLTLVAHAETFSEVLEEMEEPSFIENAETAIKNDQDQDEQ